MLHHTSQGLLLDQSCYIAPTICTSALTMASSHLKGLEVQGMKNLFTVNRDLSSPAFEDLLQTISIRISI